MNNKRLTNLHIVAYIIALFALWSVRELVVQPLFLTPLSPLASALIGEAIKLLVWTLPAILLIRHYHNDMHVGLKEMFTNKLQWSRDYLFAIVILALFIVRPLHTWFVFGEFGLSPTFAPVQLIGGVLFVGITEEIVFRGFLLNAFLKKMKMPYAVALDAILFTLIHYPIWIYNGLGTLDFVTRSISIAIVSALFFACSFIRTRNILVPIALHMAWNLSIFLFIS